MRMVRTTVCRVSRPWARSAAADRSDRTPLVGRHTESCLRCQVETAIEQRIGRTLASMGDNLMPAPVGLVSAVMDRLDTLPVRPGQRSIKGDREVRHRGGGGGGGVGAGLDPGPQSQGRRLTGGPGPGGGI